MTRYNRLLTGLQNALGASNKSTKIDNQESITNISHSQSSCDLDDSPEECEKEKLEDKLELELLKKRLKKLQSSMPFSLEDMVKNINPNCIHYGSKGRVCGIEKLPDEMGEVIAYQTTNEGKNWKIGDIIKKTANQLSFDYEEDDDDEEDHNDTLSEEESEMDHYKQSYYDMSVGSLRAIMSHAKDILDYLDNPMVKENLTAPHLQGIIAVAEDHMRGIHDFVMFVETDDDDYEETESVEQNKKKRKKIKISDLPHYEYQYKKYPGVTTTMGAGNRPGLWENIRKKKEREGKNYKPAKPGDKDRPDPKQWKKLSK